MVKVWSCGWLSVQLQGPAMGCEPAPIERPRAMGFEKDVKTMTLFPYQVHLEHMTGRETHRYAYGEYSEGPFNISSINSHSFSVLKDPDFATTLYKKKCVYCGGHMRSRHSDERQRARHSDAKISRHGTTCSTCGWWVIQVNAKVDREATNDDCLREHFLTYESIISRFTPEAWIPLIGNISQEVLSFRKSIADLTPREVEELVASILGQSHKCDVLHVGRSRDQGIDLLVLRGESTIPVQVKHRSLERRARSEGVVPVRSFIGAVFAKGHESAIYATTEERYSKDSQEFASDVSVRGIELSLLSATDLISIINGVRSDQNSEYERVWGHVFLDDSGYHRGPGLRPET